jgi:Ca-activated chloride channel family protein
MWVHVERVHWVWLVLAFAGGLFALERVRANRLGSFLSPAMQARLASTPSGASRALQLGLVVVSLVAAIVAAMRLQNLGDRDSVTTSRRAADVMFVLDTSRSMLADDTPPTRLARAKSEIRQLVDRLDGHRVGLVAFAGRAAQICPLTPDRSFFRTALSTVDTRSAGRGGSRIGEAIKGALRGFPPGGGAKLIVLVTDGDDQDPYSEEAAKLARDAGVRIVAVGLGSEQGSQITLVDPQTKAKTLLVHDGKPVISKLDGDKLSKIALATEGAYIPVGTAAIDLDSILEGTVQPLIREQEALTTRFVPRELYPWFVLLSLVSLLAALALGARRQG